MEGNVHILVRVQPNFTNAVQPWIADRFNRKKEGSQRKKHLYYWLKLEQYERDIRETILPPDQNCNHLLALFFVFAFNASGISLIGSCFFWNTHDSDDNHKRNGADITSPSGARSNLVYLASGVL